MNILKGDWIVYAEGTQAFGYAQVDRLNGSLPSVRADGKRVEKSRIVAHSRMMTPMANLCGKLNDLPRQRAEAIAEIDQQFANRRAALLAPYKETEQ